MDAIVETIEVNASPKACYDVITDYAKYPEFLKETKRCVVNKKKANHFEVTFTLEIIKEFSYTISIEGKPGKHLSWSLISSDIMKINSGEWQIEEISKNKTRLTYTISEIKLSLFVPSMITKKLVGSNLPGMMKSFKARIEEKV